MIHILMKVKLQNGKTFLNRLYFKVMCVSVNETQHFMSFEEELND